MYISHLFLIRLLAILYEKSKTWHFSSFHYKTAIQRNKRQENTKTKLYSVFIYFCFPSSTQHFRKLSLKMGFSLVYEIKALIQENKQISLGQRFSFTFLKEKWTVFICLVYYKIYLDIHLQNVRPYPWGNVWLTNLVDK